MNYSGTILRVCGFEMLRIGWIMSGWLDEGMRSIDSSGLS